jgi:hypothetical protein
MINQFLFSQPGPEKSLTTHSKQSQARKGIKKRKFIFRKRFSPVCLKCWFTTSRFLFSRLLKFLNLNDFTSISREIIPISREELGKFESWR